ncbi:sensor domain-containing phosphodiesterase [Devosia submarina]|uniref:sensor domain-containing phosphodiesterase n=1 Tax=Devosia submarina TaxID=1173082 RepID=UPI000D363968|nr:diguanylate cyclase [Devosia submarina]
MTAEAKFSNLEESRRVATLKALEILDTPPALEFDRITELAAKLLIAPIAQISLIDEHRQWLKSCAGAPRGEVPRGVAFCNETIRSSGPLVVPNVTEDERFADNPFVVGAPHVCAYAGVPLVIDESAVGTLCVIYNKARSISENEIALLETLAAIVVDQLYAHRKSVALVKSEERFRLAAVASSDAMYEWDLGTDTLMWAAGHEHQSAGGYIQFGRSGAEWTSSIHPDDRNRIALDIYGAINGAREYWHGEYRFRRTDGSYADVIERCVIVRSSAGTPLRIVGAVHDISTQRAAEARLQREAHHDALTGLPNRAMFLEHLEKAMAQAAEHSASVGVIYLDLDAFKDINDTLGHDAGDAVLIGAAKALQASLPVNALAARIGGDEFAVIYPEQCTPAILEALARSLMKEFGAPVPFNGHELSCKASLGLALYPQSDERPGELMKNADLALCEAKRAGGNQYAFFTPKIRQVVQNRISALACAKDALARDAVMPFYQPKVSLETGKICGFEALLRWEHPREGIQPPGLIKEAFDDPVLSLELGKRMLDRVIEDMHAWRSTGVQFGSVAINLSADQFFRTDIATTILTSLAHAGLQPRDLEVEVTESVFLGDGSEAVAHALDKLHDAGVQIALDDFGTGFASLTHLNKFPVSWLKIDRSF